MVVHPRSRRPTWCSPTSRTAELGSWLDAIAEITRAANRDAPLDELMDLIAGATAHLTGYDFVPCSRPTSSAAR